MSQTSTAASRFSLLFLQIYGLLFFSLFYLLHTVVNWHEGVDRVLVLFAAACVVFAAASIQCGRLEGGLGVKSVLFWALAARVVLVLGPAHPTQTLSSDLYRYLWEGRLVEQGVSPYRYAPISDEIAAFRVKHIDVWQYVDHKEVAAIYPPAAQFLFAALPANQQMFRLVLVGFDFALLLLLARWLSELGGGGQLRPLILYAWLPLAIVEIGGNGHLEALFLPCMVAGLYFGLQRGAMVLACALTAAAAAVKFVAAVPLAFLLNRILRDAGASRLDKLLCLAVPAVVWGLLYWPFLEQGNSLGGLGTFARDWRFNGGVFYSIEWFVRLFDEGSAHWIVKGAAVWAVLFVLLLLLRRKASPIDGSICVLSIAVLLSPVIYPWYLLWFAPLLPLAASPVLRYSLAGFCCTAFLSYEVLSHPGYWEVSPMLMLFELSPLLAGLLVHFYQVRKKVDSV